jgi:hypothetical protein
MKKHTNPYKLNNRFSNHFTVIDNTGWLKLNESSKIFISHQRNKEYRGNGKIKKTNLKKIKAG